MSSSPLVKAAVLCLFLAGGALVCGLQAETNWVTVLDERFEDNALNRFRMFPVGRPGFTSSGADVKVDRERPAVVVDGFTSLTRPLRAGAHVELRLNLEFGETEREAPAEMKSQFQLVLFNRHMAGVEFVRSTNQSAPALVRFTEMVEGRPVKVLREFNLGEQAPDGDWRLLYRHGLMTLVHGTIVLGSADLGTLGIQVAGVSWMQHGGKTSCSRMTLEGEPLLERTAEQNEVLKQAAALNELAQQQQRAGRLNEALSTMEKASALFVEVNDEMHHDSANSFANLASIRGDRGEHEAARDLWEKALGIHEKTLGERHPHTTLTRFNLGKSWMDSGDKAKAKVIWTRCRDDWRDVLGPDYRLVKSLDDLLPRL